MWTLRCGIRDDDVANVEAWLNDLVREIGAFIKLAVIPRSKVSCS